MEYDGFSQLWFDDLASMASAIDAQGPVLLDDERAFVGDLDLVMVEPTTVIEPPEGEAVKRISTLRRRPDTSAAKFVAEWRVHADLVRRMPGVLGYGQNSVVARAKDTGSKSGRPTATYDQIAIDGIVEMWFPDTAAIDGAFRSVEGQETMRSARSFIADINTYLVECVTVL